LNASHQHHDEGEKVKVLSTTDIKEKLDGKEAVAGRGGDDRAGPIRRPEPPPRIRDRVLETWNSANDFILYGKHGVIRSQE
jgi:hypothetical protein